MSPKHTVQYLTFGYQHQLPLINEQVNMETINHNYSSLNWVLYYWIDRKCITSNFDKGKKHLLQNGRIYFAFARAEQRWDKLEELENN